jgi:hypothetical protein
LSTISLACFGQHALAVVGIGPVLEPLRREDAITIGIVPNKSNGTLALPPGSLLRIALFGRIGHGGLVFGWARRPASKGMAAPRRGQAARVRFSQ